MDQEQIASVKEKAKRYLYYIIIGLVSVVFVVFLPFVGSEGDIVSRFPTTTTGWFVWVISNVTTAILNVVIYICFMEQGELNSKEDPKYKEANELLSKVEALKKKEPRSPKQWKKRQYSTKGVITFCSTLMSLIGLSNAILRWDYTIFLVYLAAIIMGLVFGLIQMKKAELYWTDEFNQYAHFIYNKQEEERKIKEAEARKKAQEERKNGKQTVSKHSRTSRKKQG